MTTAESGTGKGQETFAIDGRPIGGPIETWGKITNDNMPIKGAWVFTNPREQNGQLIGYNFQFPEGALADIYIEDSGKQRVFTTMGGKNANLNSHYKVEKIELFMNSRFWNKDHEGKWSEWEKSGDSFKQTDIWQPIGVAPRKVETPPTPTAPETPAYTWTERDKQNDKRALKWVLAGILVLGGVGWLTSVSKTGKANPEPYVPAVTVPTANPAETSNTTATENVNPYKYDTYDLKLGDTWTAPTNSIIVIPRGSGIVVRPPATENNRLELNVVQAKNPADSYDFLVIHVSQAPLQISTPDNQASYQTDVTILSNIVFNPKDGVVLWPGGPVTAVDAVKILGNSNLLFVGADESGNFASLNYLCNGYQGNGGYPAISCTTS